MSNRLIMTVGLPRSGKSTWAKAQGLPIVNPDAIHLAIHGQRFSASAAPAVWTIAHYMVKALFLAGHTDVILDATNTLFTRRAEWQNPAWIVQVKVFDTDADTCKSRAFACGYNDLFPVIDRMAEAYSPPSEFDTYEG
jgi:predicted kinase